MKKLRPINTFVEGDKVQGFYLCVEKHLRYTRSGDIYIDLELRDVTGNITAKVWDNVSVLNEKFIAGNAVAVSGIIETYLDRILLLFYVCDLELPRLQLRQDAEAENQYTLRMG